MGAGCLVKEALQSRLYGQGHGAYLNYHIGVKNIRLQLKSDTVYKEGFTNRLG